MKRRRGFYVLFLLALAIVLLLTTWLAGRPPPARPIAGPEAAAVRRAPAAKVAPQPKPPPPTPVAPIVPTRVAAAPAPAPAPAATPTAEKFTITGRVTYENGEPATGAVICGVNAEQWFHGTKPEPNGAFRMADVPGGAFGLDVHDFKGGVAQEDLTLDGPPRTVDVNLVVRQEPPITTGRVRSSQGEGMDLARVRVRRESDGLEYKAPMDLDEPWRFTTRVPAGRHFFVIELANRTSFVTGPYEGAQPDLVIIVPAGGSIEGTCPGPRDSGDAVEVRVFEAGRHVATAPVDERGRFRIDRIAGRGDRPTVYAVGAFRPGGAGYSHIASCLAAVRDGEVTTVALATQPWRRVTFRIEGYDAQEAQSWGFQVRDACGILIEQGNLREGVWAGELPEAALTLHRHVKRGEVAHDETFVVPAGAAELTIRPPSEVGTLSGIMRPRRAHNAAGDWGFVEVVATGPRLRATRNCAPDGSFVFHRLPTGTYRVTAEGYQVAEVVCELGERPPFVLHAETPP